jgi:hypothetical protein
LPGIWQKSKMRQPYNWLYFNIVKNIEITTLYAIASSVIVSNEGVFYKFMMQLKINRLWTNIEVMN